jgi:hypothetical protein
MPGPQKGAKYGPRHNENCVPMVVLHERGGYGIATWREQTTEEQCDWIKRYLYENDDECFSEEQKASRKVKVCRWTKAHKNGKLAPAHLRAVEIYYEHFQLRHNLRERDKENAKLRERLDIEKKIYWDEVEAREKDMDENVELRKENERLKKQLEAMSGVNDETLKMMAQSLEDKTGEATSRLDKVAKDLREMMVGKVLVEEKEYGRLKKLDKWIRSMKGKKVKVQF